jgi:hypothetical protein
VGKREKRGNWRKSRKRKNGEWKGEQVVKKEKEKKNNKEVKRKMENRETGERGKRG